MFTNITIKNFRCFESLELPQLARVNLITGMNNTGKTALLEAIHLHCHPNDCGLAISISKQRGVPEPRKDVPEWGGWLFRRQDGQLGFAISSNDETGVNRTLTTWLIDSITAREQFPEAEKELQDRFRADAVESFVAAIIHAL